MTKLIHHPWHQSKTFDRVAKIIGQKTVKTEKPLIGLCGKRVPYSQTDSATATCPDCLAARRKLHDAYRELFGEDAYRELLAGCDPRPRTL